MGYNSHEYGESVFKTLIKTAIYGLGTETERFLKEYGDKYSIVGLLDSFRTEGELYGYPIISIEDILSTGVSRIIVVARPGSCKAISKKIGDFCRDNGISLFDVRGKDLLQKNTVSYDLRKACGYSREELIDRIDNAEAISFDLFDTLIMRKVISYTDIFEIMECRLSDKGIKINDFAGLRLWAEKELSKEKAPRLEEIYDLLLMNSGCSVVTASELAEMEWELDLSLMTPREAVKEVYRYALSKGKVVTITTDCYYSKEKIALLLNRSGIEDYDSLFVSCEEGTSKTQDLFEKLTYKYNDKKILHIGDDIYADMEKAGSHGIEAFRILSAADIMDALGGLNLEEHISNIADRLKTGLFLSRIFNDPFPLADGINGIPVGDCFDIGYLFCAPMITDFVLWLREQLEKSGYDEILLVARDGYLIDRLFKIAGYENKAFYFLSSRSAAIRAGMESKEDIGYVDSMKYFGSPEDELKERFGIRAEDIRSIDRESEILKRSEEQRKNYRKYINKLGISDSDKAMFDFVAKGTVQLYLQRLFTGHLKGFYFLQLEPEFMADKGLDIEPFYSDKEKDDSAIFDNYYILETFLTSPDPQLLEFDENGDPVFAKELRSENAMKCFENAGKGIETFFEEYIKALPGGRAEINKKLDEAMLSLINRVSIQDEDFLSLKVEDPFFGRMTDIKDVLG